jgi:transcriptional regulator with XRE-family HTH domain
MALPIYAKSLIALMKYLGWEQQQIAERLAVSPPMVSLWANGVRPVSQRHEKAFMALVVEALRAREDQGIGLDEHGLDEQMQPFLYAWVDEMAGYIDAYWENIRLAIQTIQQVDVTRTHFWMQPSQQETVQQACQTVIRHLNYVKHLDQDAMFAAGAGRGFLTVYPLSGYVADLYQIYSNLDTEGD